MLETGPALVQAAPSAQASRDIVAEARSRSAEMYQEGERLREEEKWEAAIVA